MDFLQYATHILSCQSKSNELRDAREVFFQWLSGHSQAGKCLVVRKSLAYPLFIRLVVSKTLDAVGREMNWIAMESLRSYRGDYNLTDCGTEIYDLT